MIGFSTKLTPGPNVPEQLIELTSFQTVEPGSAPISVISTVVEKAVAHNLKSLMNILVFLTHRPKAMRFFELPPNILPLINHEKYFSIYKCSRLSSYIQASCREIGDYARLHGIRLGLRLSSENVLNSRDDHIRRQSVVDVIAATMLAGYLGYCRRNLDFHIAARLSDKGCEAALKQSMKAISKEAHILLAFENSASCDTETTLLYAAQTRMAMLFNSHADWIDRGVLLNANDPLMQQIAATWEPTYPVLRYSQIEPSLLEPLGQEDDLSIPDHSEITTCLSKAEQFKLSKDLPNHALNFWAVCLVGDFHVLVDSTSTIQSAQTLHRSWTSLEVEFEPVS